MALGARPGTWKDLVEEEQQGFGELAGTQGKTWEQRSTKAWKI